jgi:hypothetical protein
MTSRQRGPPPSSVKSANSAYPYGRQGNSEDRDARYCVTTCNSGYLTGRGGTGEGYLENNESGKPAPYTYRLRSETNIPGPTDGNRYPRSLPVSSQDDGRLRTPSAAVSPNPLYREENRPRSGHTPVSASSRDYYNSADYQPPQFPFAPPKSSFSEGQDIAGRRSNPNSRTQSPIPTFPATPPATQPRYDTSGTPEQLRPRGGGNTRQTVAVQDQKSSDNPPALPPLNFSPKSPKDPYSLLAGTPFDNRTSPENFAPNYSPPAPIRPPPPPPPTRQIHAPSPRTTEQRRPSIHPQPMNEQDLLNRSSPQSDNKEEKWTLDRVIEFLRENGFGEPWQEAFRDAGIEGDKFRACMSLREVKKLVHFPSEANQPVPGKTYYKLITLIRKALNPDEEMPDSEIVITPRQAERPHQLPRRETAPVINPSMSYPSLPSPESPDFPEPSPRVFPRHNSEKPTYTNRLEASTPKLQPPPPPRERSPQTSKRPISPGIKDPRPQALSSISPANGHAKTTSSDSNISEQSIRSAIPPARTSQDFQDILQKLERERTVIPQKRVDKKKSHEQMSKPGLFSRLWQRREQITDPVIAFGCKQLISG